MNLFPYINRFWIRFRYFIVHEVIHADDTPHRIAFGCAIGVFVALTPTIPFQMLLAVLICWLLGANKIVGVPAVWITNPLTIVPIYLPQYILGCWMLGIPVGEVDFHVLTKEYESISVLATVAWNLMKDIFWPLWFGSLFVATGFGLLTYYLTWQVVVRYRLHRYGSVEPPPPVLDLPSAE